MSATSAPSPGLRRDATVISLVGFCHGTSHFFHFVLPTLFPWLMRDFRLTFTQVGATNQWQIHSGLDGHNEVITLQNGATVNASDFVFV